MCEKLIKTQTNPRYPGFVQAIFTAGDREQFDFYRKKVSLKIGPVDLSDNIFSDKCKFTYLILSNHCNDRFQNLTAEAIDSTFGYLFHKFKKGIFISVVGNSLLNFLPFENANYVNEFSHMIAVEPGYSSVQQFLDRVSKLSGYIPTQMIPLDEWQANNSMFRYEKKKFENDSNVVLFENMFSELTKRRNVPDVEFFVNKRDFPLMWNSDSSEQMMEPYFHLFGRTPLISHDYGKYAPVFSCATSYRFADRAIPTYEDWARACFQESGKVFPNDCKKYPRIVQTPWEKKKSVAVFRGSSTGSGTTPANNQRLKALSLAESSENKGRLDFGITKWNLRPRKFEDDVYLRTIERKTYPIAKPLTLQEQSQTFKYILNLEGHVAAFRLSYELSSGSVILLARSEWEMWINKFLRPYEHYVPVREDLSDLFEIIDWCKTHDDKCKQIAENALNFYENYLGTEGILDYLQKLLTDVARNSGRYSYLPDIGRLFLEEEQEWLKNVEYSDEIFPHPVFPGPRCVGRLDATLTVFRSKPSTGFTFVKPMFKNKNGIVECFKTNDFFLARKTASSQLKQMEHDHEAFIGLNAVNQLVSKCPNFAYVYGKPKDSETQVFVEYIGGQTLADWLISPLYNFKDYVSILIQLNLALSVAQRVCGFIHYDLYPWNIIIQTLKEGTSFDYIVGGKIVRYQTSLIPVMIDFGKSRAVIFEKEFGLIDHGMIELFKANSIYDTITLLVSTVHILEKRLTDNERKILENFWQNVIGIKGSAKHLHKFGALFHPIDNAEDPFEFTPMTFVDYLFVNFGDARMTSASSFASKMSKGNPTVEAEFMKTGNRKTAILETIAKIGRQTIPKSSNQIVSRFVQTLLKQRVKDFEELLTGQDQIVKKRWELLKSYFSKEEPAETVDVTIDFPYPIQLNLFSQMSPETLNTMTEGIVKIDTDWLSTWNVCIEAAIINRDLDIFDIFSYDIFSWSCALASNNTALKIAQLE